MKDNVQHMAMILIASVLMALCAAVYLKLKQGLYYRVRFLLTAGLGASAMVVGFIRLAGSIRPFDGVGIVLVGLGAAALYQLRFAACDLVLTRLGRMPVVYRLLTAKHIELLKELVDLIERDQLNCLIGGGLACDALMTGYLTHIPCDVDLVCLSEDEPAVRSALVRAGFVLTANRPDQVVAYRKGTIMIDVLIWQSRGDGKIQHLFGADLVVVPKALFRDQRRVQLNGINLAIQGAGMLACVAPWTSRKKHQAFLESASPSHSATGPGQWREALVKVRVTEYAE